MRRLVVAVFVVGVALSLVGCGGSSDTSTPASSSTAAPVAAAPAAGQTGLKGAPTTLPDIVNRSENETTTFAPFPTGENVPDVLKQKITTAKQPTLIFFFDSGQKVSTDTRTMIDAIRNRNRGMVDLVAYDLSKYVTANSDGTVVVDPSLAADPAQKQVVMFARDPAINVAFTPFIVLTDSQGYIIYKHSGLPDSAFLERQVQRAAR
ncbi:MAG: hypothetical protein P4L93_08615 [Coriobacteriia bacterium]|nr:hypothetical protein [Coriobacteriia bacterium]